MEINRGKNDPGGWETPFPLLVDGFSCPDLNERVEVEVFAVENAGVRNFLRSFLHKHVLL